MARRYYKEPTLEQRILFTFWGTRDTLISILESSELDGFARPMLEDLRDENAEMLDFYGSYLRGEPVPEEALWPDE